MNNFSGTGRLLRDVDIKVLPNSETVIGKTAIAIDRAYHKGEDKKSDFINLTLWGKTAEFAAKYSGSGKLVEITGRIETGSYVKKDGSKAYTFDIIVESFKPIEWANTEEDKPQAKTYNKGNDSDIPF